MELVALVSQRWPGRCPFSLCRVPWAQLLDLEKGVCSKLPTFCHMGMGPSLFGRHRKAIREVVFWPGRGAGGVSEPQGAGGRWSREVASPVSQLCLGVALAQLPGVSDR